MNELNQGGNELDLIALRKKFRKKRQMTDFFLDLGIL